MTNENKKTLTKEEFLEKMISKSHKKFQSYKEKKYWNNFEEKNATKSKFRW